MNDSRLLFPCTFLQERWLLLSRLFPGTAAFNISIRWEIRGRLSTSAIENAYRSVIERHEILRSRIVEDDGRTMQEVLGDIDFRLSLLDLSMLDPAQQEAQYNFACENEAHQPIDLTKAPLIRAFLIRFGDDRAVLQTTAHRAIFDGLSIRILGREIAQMATAFDRGEKITLAPLPLQYGDYSLWLDEFSKSGAIDIEMRHWLKKLEGIPYFEVTTDSPRPWPRKSESAIVSCVLPSDLGHQLEEAARKTGVSVFALGAALISATLVRVTDADEVNFSTQLSGRNDSELDDLIGAFVNTVILRVKTEKDMRLSDLVSEVASESRDAMLNPNVPYPRLVEELSLVRDPRWTQLASVNVIVQRAFMEDVRYDNVEFVGIPSVAVGVEQDINFFMIGRADGWRMSIEYSEALYNAKTMEDILDFWRDTIAQYLQDPTRQLSQLSRLVRTSTAKSPQIERIEESIRNHRAVSEVTARAAIAESIDESFEVFVVVKPTTREPLETLPDVLTRHVADQLGATPSVRVSLLASMPRRADGAIDVGALPHLAPRHDTAIVPKKSIPNDIEQRVIEIWSAVLGPHGISPSANFFELGGHSLSALRISVRAQEAFATKVDVGALFAAPTVREYSEYIASCISAPEKAHADWQIVTIQSGGNQTPVITINNTMMYANLAREFSGQRSFFGIQLFDAEVSHDLAQHNFAEIVSEYVKLIRAARPEGPYILVGHCVAGVIAFVAAQQLKLAGEEVELVVLLDTWHPAWQRSLPAHHRAILAANQRLASFKRRWRSYRTGATTFPEFLGTYGFVRKLKILDLLVSAGAISKVPPVEDWANRWFLPHLLAASSKHAIAPYDGDVLIFYSDEVPRGRLYDSNLGWGDVIKGNIAVHHAPGHHMTMSTDANARSIIAGHMKAQLGALTISGK